MSSREDYIKALEVNSLIAFKLDKLEAKMYSGKVTKIGKTKVEVETKNGRKFFINKEDIHWVNITGKWPAHIMQALKGVDIEEVSDEDNINIGPSTENVSEGGFEALENVQLDSDIDIKLVDDEIIEVKEDVKESIQEEN